MHGKSSCPFVSVFFFGMNTGMQNVKNQIEEEVEERKNKNTNEDN
jgi:hypothetical protein